MTLAGLSNRQKLIRVVALILGLVAAAMLATSALDRQAKGPTRIVLLSPAELEAEFSSLHGDAQSGTVANEKLFSAFAAFASSHASMAAKLEDWARQYPKSAAAQAALGVHYAHMARLVRGSRGELDINEKMRGRMAGYGWRAASAFESALALDPQSLIAYVGLLAVHSLSGDDLAFIKTSSGAFQHFPTSKHLHTTVLASLAPQSGGTDAAMTNYVAGVSATLQDDDLTAELWRTVDYWRAKSRFEHGDAEGAWSLTAHHLGKRTTTDFLVLRAQLNWQHSNTEAALADLKQAISLDPDSLDARLLTAKFLSRDRQFEAARTFWQGVFEQDPLNPEYLQSFALALHVNGFSDAAIPVLEQALIVGLHDHTIRDDLLSHYERLNRYDDAIREMETVMTLRDRDPYYWRRAITLFANANDCRAQDLAEDFRRMCRSEDCSSAGDPVTLALISRPRLTKQCNGGPTVTALSLDQ